MLGTPAFVASAFPSTPVKCAIARLGMSLVLLGLGMPHGEPECVLTWATALWTD